MVETTILSVKNSLISKLQKFVFWFCFYLTISNSAAGQSLIEKGKYIFHASGGCRCHTDTSNNGEFLAGGRPIKTPFGTFLSSNIRLTPQLELVIGAMMTSFVP